MRAALLGLLLVALVLAPPALAQLPTGGGVVQSQVTVAVEDPGRALQPGKLETVNVLVNYFWSPGAVPGPGSEPAGEQNQTQRTRVTLAVKQMPSWVANATFANGEVIEVEVQGPGSSNAPNVVPLVLGIAPDAPALQREDIIVTAAADANGNIGPSRGESPPVKLRGAVVARVNVTSEASQIVPGGRWTVMPFTVRNDGNTELKVQLNVTARPQDSQVEYPTTVTIPRNESARVEVRLRVPWTYSIGGIVELEAIPLVDDEEGKPARSEIEVLGQSAVPVGPLAGLAVILAALGRRR